MRRGRSDIAGVRGKADLTRRHRSALVAALACASLMVATVAAEAATTRSGAKSSLRRRRPKPRARPRSPLERRWRRASPSDKKSTSHKTVVPQVPLAQGPPPQTSDAEIALVKSAIDGLRSGGASKATSIQATISDPVARKLVEWIILRSDHNGASSTRYLAFIAANPSWPSPAMFRRRAEAMLWVENVKPAQALSFFNGSPPQSGMGRLVLARALARAGRHRRRERAGARGLAQRSVVRRCREAGARALFRSS